MADGATPRVLLVSDTDSFRQRVARRFAETEPDGDVLTDADPLAALERLDATDVDCIVFDADRPADAAAEFLRAVRERDGQIPVIALVAETGPDAAALLDAGATTTLRRAAVRERIDRLTTAVHDAVGTRRVRERLREGFELLDTVLGSLDDIVYVTDIEGQPLYWNEAATRVTGYSSAEARSLDLFEFFPESEHEAVAEALEAVLETGSVTFEADLLTKAGERVRYEFSSTVFRNEAGECVGICGTGRDITRHYRYERTLRALHRTTRELFEAQTREEIARTTADATEHIIDNPLSTVYLHEDGLLVPAAATSEVRELFGDVPRYRVEEDVPVPRCFRTGESELVPDTDDIDDGRTRAGVGALYLPLGEYGVLAIGFRQGESLADTHRELASILAANAEAALTRQADERAIQHRERMLETLHATTRRLIRTSEPGEVADIIATDASEILDFTTTAVFLRDERSGALRPVAETGDVEALFGSLSPVKGPDGPVWETFVDAETTVIEDAAADGTATRADDEAAAGSRLLVPVGEYGVLLAGSEEPAAFSEPAVGFAELLATNAATAIERAERERTLEEKDRTLEARNEELGRLNRLNAIIRTLNEGLIRADSRAEIQAVVCETLTDVSHYRFAWVGRESAVEETLTPLAFEGEGRGILDHVVERSRDGTASVPEQARERDEPVVINNIHRDDRAAPWRKAALNRGFQSLVCLPLSYNGHRYGFIGIYADRPGIFTDEEVDVLSEVAALVANAINAVERKEALLTGRETELAFEFEESDDPLSQLARQLEATIEVDGLVPRGSDSWVVYATVHGADATAVTAAVEESAACAEVSVLRSDEEATLVSVAVADFSVVNAFVGQNATVRTFRVGTEGGSVTVTIPPSTDVRTFVESCQERLPTLRLVRRQAVTSEASGSGLKYDLTDLLTDKQLEALQTAYFTGYFEWPRDATGVDVAESLDVSPPTFQQHLRKGLHRIFEDALETNAAESD